MNSFIINFIPYLSFDGNCEEALNFYSNILDGKVNIQQRYDNPAMNAPDEYKDKILHAEFEFGNYKIFASDIFPGKQFSRGSSDISMSFAVSDPVEGQKLFDKLSEGGKVHVPFKKQFWGDWHGNFTDKYGIKWMINCSQQ